MNVWVNGSGPRTGKRAERAIALSTAIAAAGLLIKLSILVSVTMCLTQLAALGVSFAAGVMLVNKGGITRYGFMLSAAGWLLVLLTLLGGQIGATLLPGIVAGGLGLGMAHGRFHSSERNISALSSVAALGVAWFIQVNSAPGVNGYGFAFALLIDLALLGAVLVSIAEREKA